MRYIFLFVLLSISTTVFAQQALFQGVVKDFETDEPVSYVSIVAQGSNSSTVTNEDGKFHIWVSANTKTLSFSHLNYDKYSLQLNHDKKEEIVVYLVATAFEMEELYLTQRPIKDIILEVLDNSQKQFSDDVVLNTYYREMLTINNEINTFGDGMLDFYYKDKKESDIIVNQSRFARFKSEEFKGYESSPLQLYLLNMQELITNAFRFTAMRDIVKEKEYGLSLTKKTSTDGNTLITLHFEPLPTAKKVALRGTMVFDEERQLVLDIEMSIHPDFVDNLTMTNRIFFHFKTNNIVGKTIFNRDGNRYYLSYKMGRIHGTVERGNHRFYAGGNYELLTVNTRITDVKPKPELIYHLPTLERLGKNYTTPYWKEQNTLILSEKERAVLGRLNEVD